MPQLGFYKIAITSFNAIPEIKILTKISEFTVLQWLLYIFQMWPILMVKLAIIYF